MDVNNQKITYIVYRPFDFSCSQKQLSYIYGPIVGKESIFLYQWLINEYNLQTELRGIRSSYSRIGQCLGCNDADLAVIRSRLEGIGLISTSLEQFDNEKVFHISINRPLSWEEFNENEKLRHLLIKEIGVYEYERISLAFTSRRIPKNSINISASFDAVYGSDEIKKLKEFNFNKLYEMLSADFKQPVLLNDDAKLVIETYFKTHNLSLAEIKKCVYKSVYKDKKNTYIADSNLLISQFRELINSATNISVFDNIKINRNASIFYGTLNENNTSCILSDYQNINSEQYLSSIQKEALNENQQKTIDHLRKVHHLPDGVINIITDFTIYRTNGTYNSKYIRKLATTINLLGLNDVESILGYLQNVGKVLVNKKYSTNEYDSINPLDKYRNNLNNSYETNAISTDDDFEWKAVEVD